MSQINVGYDVNCPQAIDRSYGRLSVGVSVPYVSVAAANLAVVAGYRYRGKTVLVDDGTGAREYWWRVDTTDGSLVPKVLSEQTIDFVVGDGQATTPVATTLVFPNPAASSTILRNCVIMSVEVEGAGIPGFVRTGFGYYTYDASGGTITLNNTNFNNTTWYKIKYRQL